MLAFINDQDRLIEFLDAPIDLIYAVLDTHGVELELTITSKREWSRWIQVMSSRQPDEMLHKTVFCSSDDLLLSDKLGKQDGLLADRYV